MWVGLCRVYSIPTERVNTQSELDCAEIDAPPTSPQDPLYKVFNNEYQNDINCTTPADILAIDAQIDTEQPQSSWGFTNTDGVHNYLVPSGILVNDATSTSLDA